MICGIFVQYTLGGSATRALTTEVLGILKVHPYIGLSCRELIRGKADNLECDGFFFDSTSQKIRFVAGYVKDGTEKDMVSQEMEISLLDQSISSKTILDTAGMEDFLHEAIRVQGKFVSYDIFRGDSIYSYARDSGGDFSEVARFLATTPCSTFTLWYNHVKH